MPYKPSFLFILSILDFLNFVEYSVFNSFTFLFIAGKDLYKCPPGAKRNRLGGVLCVSASHVMKQAEEPSSPLPTHTGPNPRACSSPASQLPLLQPLSWEPGSHSLPFCSPLLASPGPLLQPLSWGPGGHSLPFCSPLLASPGPLLRPLSWGPGGRSLPFYSHFSHSQVSRSGVLPVVVYMAKLPQDNLSQSQATFQVEERNFQICS